MSKMMRKKVVRSARKEKASMSALKGKIGRQKTASERKPVDRVADPVGKTRTKSDVITVLSSSTGLSKKEITSVFASLSELITFDLGKKGPGSFTIPGLAKMVKVHKPATKARKGINPFTKEPMTFKPKPARNLVRIRPLKGLKESIN